ncbi:Uncharacterised protein [Suttonella indologenes]|uniref:Uncharacterized protein n=1 Tax=Suttonella indologenes TaxID=13276 RepID=A0A380N0Z0_9GAMM|nr:Uncharacterised protein [Suttonella indologenes]
MGIQQVHHIIPEAVFVGYVINEFSLKVAIV